MPVAECLFERNDLALSYAQKEQWGRASLLEVDLKRFTYASLIDTLMIGLQLPGWRKLHDNIRELFDLVTF